MKKLVLTTFVFLLTLGRLFAGPVDVNTAKAIGEKYVRANMASLRNFQTSKHIGTFSDDNGNSCLYLFNIEDKGFYIVAADDRSKPILAYSDEGALDINNLPSSMEYYLNRYQSAISFAIENNLEAEPEIVEEWNLVRTKGDVTRNKLDRAVQPLINLLWNQDSPYNYFCPMAYGGPGGRAYVGCAADAMAMVMKYWNYPDKGVGEHSYTPAGFPEQSVNFEVEYDWDNMPIQVYNSSSQTQIQAVALLMYHCGVSIDMNYGATGSGAYTQDVPRAMESYFKYTGEMELEYRDGYTKLEWEDKLIKNFDQGFPALYAGHDQGQGGHAFICDGYTNDRYFHFNWGWSGHGNGNFAIDALNAQGWHLNDGQNAIFDMIPDYAYDNMPKSPEISAEIKNTYSHKGIITVEVPTHSESDIELASIDEVVVMRNGAEVYVESDVTPGSLVTFEDEVPEYDNYEYTVYVVSEGVKGRFGSESLLYGPTCEWKLISTTTSFQGWNGGCLHFLTENGSVFESFTTSNSSPVSESIQIPEGNFSVQWSAPRTPINNMTLKLKNSSNEVVYEFSGSSNSLSGTLYSGNNTCENCQAPQNLAGEYKFMNGQSGALISWDKKGEPQSYIIYRSNDNDDYDEIARVSSSENQYFDVVDAGEYYYQVTAYNGSCESMPAVSADGEYEYVMIVATSIKENAIDAVIYPNPTSGMLNINAEGMTNISVYNVVGQKVVDQTIDTDEYILDMSSMEKGVYMLKVVSRNGEMTERIVVMD